MNSFRNIFSALTFVGVIFHEFGHKLFCDLTGLKVYKVCYFRFGNPAGYVIHERPKNFFQSFFVAVGPFISGTFFALFFFYLAEYQITELWQKILFIWLGISIAVNAFPSDTDAKNLWRDANRQIRSNLLAIIGYPFAIVIWLVNALSVFWIELIYALFLYYLVNPFFK
jgi:hypothetical protein